MPPYARPVNMMFQSYALFPHMDVAGNIAFGLRQERMDRRRIAARVDGDAGTGADVGIRPAAAA